MFPSESHPLSLADEGQRLPRGKFPSLLWRRRRQQPKHFDFHPEAIIRTLDLRHPVYRQIATYGNFGRKDLAWDRADKAEVLRKGAGL